jgi:hypothetical protein
MLSVAEKFCQFHADRSRGMVVVESDAEGPPFTQSFAELESVDARTLAQGYAATQGVVSARINGNLSSPYPVNAQGEPLDAVKGPDGSPLPAAHPRMQPSKYRIDVPVCTPLR